MAFLHCLLLMVFVGVTVALSGEFIPKSFYVIGENGQQSDVTYIRNRRDFNYILSRIRRGGGSGAYASSSAQASASSNVAASGRPIDFSDIIPTIQNFANFPAGLDDLGGGKAGAQSFSTSGSSSTHGGGSGNQGLGTGYETGYQGPILFSRSGEDHGTGVKVSGVAVGQRGAFSSSSSSIDSDGKIKYSVQSGKY